MDKGLPYQLLEKLSGGSQPIYRVKAADGRVLILKTVPAAGITPEMRERFFREAQIASEIDHPNLIKVYDHGEAGGMLYQAMDYLEGVDLEQALRNRVPLTWDQKFAIMLQVCAGLGKLHENGIVHRDVKPSNIFLENSGRIRLLDYGVARTEASELTRAGMAVGTVSYMAPEQIRGDTCTAASDVFSTAAVFYELASGRHPFCTAQSDVPQMIQAILFQPPPPLESVAPGAPTGLSFLLAKALEKDVAQRTRSVDDLKRAIDLCQSYAAQPQVAAAAAAPQKEEDEYQKTMVIERPVIKSPAPAPTPAPPPAPAAPRLVYCASCTFGNPPGTLICQRCRAPLADSMALPGAPRPPAASSGQRTLIVVLVAMVVLLLAAIAYLLLAR